LEDKQTNSQIKDIEVAWEAAHLTKEELDRKLAKRKGRPFKRIDREAEKLGATHEAAARRIVEAKLNANIDLLTGLFNRRFLETVLPKEVERARRQSLPLALVMLDVDNFKRINDSQGHPAGDNKLREIARILQNMVRRSDIVCRWGGEEFVLLLPEVFLETDEDGQGLNQHLEKIRQAVAKVAVDQENRVGTVSMGVAMLNPDMIGEDLLKAADEALYQAKNNGRDQIKWARVKAE